MNYHTNHWITSKLAEHALEAETLIPKDHIVLVALQGSQNYGLDYEDSDVDTKCITTPSFKDIALARKPLSTTHIRENDEHIDLKDIRLYLETFKKQNLNFLEILYTPYFYLPNYCFKEQWDRLVKHREEITHYDPVRSVKSMMGVASEKYFALEHHYPSRMPWIEKYGYDPKQLSHLLRISEYLDRYLAREPYGDCMVSRCADYLINVKKGYYDLDEAKDIATTTYQDITEKGHAFINAHSNDTVNVEIDELLDDVAYNIMRISVKGDFDNE